jgi:membrane protein YdbS with pleckstrin-like domain
MKLPMRRILRVVLSVLILVILWTRTAAEWRQRSVFWLAGSLTLSIILLLVVLVELTGAQQKWRKQRDQVPKKPLGLDT